MAQATTYVGPIAKYLLTEYIKKDPGVIAESILQINAYLNAVGTTFAQSEHITMRKSRKHTISFTCSAMGKDQKLLGEIECLDRTFNIEENISKIKGLPQTIIAGYAEKLKNNDLQVCDVFGFLPNDSRPITDIKTSATQTNGVWLMHDIPTPDEIREQWSTWQEIMDMGQ